MESTTNCSEFLSPKYIFSIYFFVCQDGPLQNNWADNSWGLVGTATYTSTLNVTIGAYGALSVRRTTYHPYIYIYIYVYSLTQLEIFTLFPVWSRQRHSERWI